MKLFDEFYNFIMAHPAQALAVWTAVTGSAQYFFSVYAQSLRTPTAASTQNYLSWYQLVNTAAGNWHRAQIPQVEASPNFEAAVEKYLQSRATATSTIAAVNQIQKDQGIPKGDIQA